MFPSEFGLCCGNGKHVLGPDLNPPIDEEWGRIANHPGMAKNSRYINQRLAFGSIHTRPSRAQGSMGFTGQGKTAVLDLHGVTYQMLYLRRQRLCEWADACALSDMRPWPHTARYTHTARVPAYAAPPDHRFSVYQHYNLGRLSGPKTASGRLCGPFTMHYTRDEKE